jgi:hypothetical protein
MSQEQEQSLLASVDDADEMEVNPGDNANNSENCNHASSFLRKIAAVMGASGV